MGKGEVFTGKLVKGEILAMNKKAWAAKFKKFARLAGVNEPKKNCHGVRKARAEVAAYADCTESQMMAMFGWTDHEDAGALHRASEPGQAGIERHGEDRWRLIRASLEISSPLVRTMPEPTRTE